MILCLFDFDGTITKADSFLEFIRFAAGDRKAALGLLMLSPILTAYKLRLIANHKAKQHVLAYFFKGMAEREFKSIAKEYSLNHIDTICRPTAMNKIAWHQEKGHKVVVVSASVECWLKPWCDRNKIDTLATKIEYNNGIVTGKLSTKNCYGNEKVNRVKAAYNLIDYEHIYAYGDSRGDKELLNLAHIKNYRVF
jgi:HAD superfamily hydrolase (TIGR01490 family)